MNRWGRYFASGFCIVTLLLEPLHAQKTTGTIRGVVSDPTGAVIPNVAVIVRNDGTGSVRTVNTNADGEYVAPELPAGTYTVTVKALSFKEAVSSAVELHVSSMEILNIQLQVGSTSEQITVNASAVQVQTASAALGEVVTGDQIRELPLNGRSFVMLTQLQPGVSAANNFDAKNKGLLTGVDFSVNGNATTSNLFLVDGANDNDIGSNRTILIYPSIESIAELKMLRNSYGPEYGQASGAVINIVTRSGSNQWHGDVLYFGRNDALNAYEYFAAGTAAQAKAQGITLPNGGKDLLRRNDFGYSLGGPIKKDKLFFFLSQEWNIERRGQTRQSCVPTAAERAGDFTTASCGEPQPTGLVAAGLANPNTPYIMNSISPGGSLIAQELPLPNLSTPLAGGANWSQSLTTPIDWNQFNVRLDYNISHSQTLMSRFTRDNWTNNAPNGNQALGLGWGDDPYPALESSWAEPSRQIVARLTSSIGTSMVNDLEFAYSDNRINVTAGGTNPGLLAQTTAAIPPVWPEKYKTSKLGIPALWGGLGGYTSYNNIFLLAPWQNSLDIYTVRDDFSKVSGAHTLRFGGFMGWQGKNELSGGTFFEYPQFSSSDWNTSIPTGNHLANVLAPGAQWGLSEQSTNIVVHIRWRDYEMYAADTWKARRNLTLDFGVRYSILTPTFQPNNQSTSFRENLYNPALGTDACNGLVTVPGYTPCANANKVFGTNFTEAAAGQNRYLRDVNYHLFAPRLGISWDPTGSGNNAIRAGFGIFYQRDQTTPSYVNSANAPFALNSNFTRTLDAQPATTIPAGGASPSGGYDPSNTVANSLQWNVTVEHGFAKNTTLEVGYVANHAIHELNSYDINYVPQSQWVNAAFQSGAGVDNLRRFPGWTAMTWWLNNGDATYNSLQILFKTQVQKFQLQTAYTWSHSIGNVTNQNSAGGISGNSYIWGPNPSLDRGNTAINRPQIFVANAVYYLPDLKGASSFVQATVGGWELTGITQFASGTSTELYQTGIQDLAGGSLSSLSGTGFTFATRPLATTVACKGVGGPAVLNPNSVTLIGYQIGTLPSGLEPRGYCRGPGYVNTDFSIDKNWRLWGEKLHLQFRLDFFNVFNHANFRGDLINSGQVFAGVNCGAPDGSGAYSACSPTNNIITHQTAQSGIGYSTLTKGPREIQYGLKLIF